ncbi:MAG: alpha-N-arabinofuranosidase [Sporolactobacillus sp.]|jgi:alpha-N-arabinofuranosidase|nr:alpha-N-arabinofuranosidase [Sporolactobacillus sp.]
MVLVKLNIEKHILADINPTLFGSFIEHMGTVIYTGIYEPSHITADSHGFRQDVLKLIRDLGVTTIRYPGGNYTSNYYWEDTIGPKNQRPRRMNIAWQNIETNQFGLDEFFQWTKLAGIANPILTVNLGTRGIDATLNLLEYCNGDCNTYWANLRRRNGHKKPYGVKYWCLGNELDGPWQIAQKNFKDYGQLANQTSKAMKLMDPQIKTILVGSSTPELNTFPSWDFHVLMEAYENVDYISMHNYIDREQSVNLDNVNKRKQDDVPTYLSRSIEFDRQINQIEAICDAVKAIKHSSKIMYLSFDEWNVHHFSQKQSASWTEHNPIDWCYFNLADTLLFGSMGLAILRHADRVKISCQALLVNTIPLILTDETGGAWCNPTYYILQSLIKSIGSHAVLLYSDLTDVDTYNVQEYGRVPMVDEVAIDNGSEIVVFFVNRSDYKKSVDIELTGEYKSIRHEVITGELDAENTREYPNTLYPKTVMMKQIDKQMHITPIRLLPYSWNVVTFAKA